MITLDPASTALVLIDLQNGIIGMDLAPRSGQEVLQAGIAQAQRFSAAGAAVILVRVAFAPDFADAPRQPVDRPMQRPADGLPPGWSDLADGLAEFGDTVVTKRNWGAFHGTDLDLQLRRRGIRTVVLGGIATNLGVESTARQAWEHGYELVVLEDMTSSLSEPMHRFSFENILPRIARVAVADELAFR